MTKHVYLIVVALLMTGALHAAVEVVTTTSSMGMLVRTVGGDQVKVTVLAAPDRDAHYLQARPQMIVALRRADLLVCVGAELEVGWLPAALQSAANPKILPGREGYFEAAAQVDLIEVGRAANRAQGDVHPMGNPHLYMDPRRMARVAIALAERLGTMVPSNAARFQSNAQAFRTQVEDRLKSWREESRGAHGVVAYHKDINYLTALLGIPILGYIEPLPGIPPTGHHLRDLVNRLQGRNGIILFTDFQPTQGPEFLARNLRWKRARLPLEPPIDASARDYLALIDRWVSAMAGKEL